jgi:heme-degrading monooxygenase HmoA
MYGRLTIIDGSPERVDLLPEAQEQAIEEDQMPGLRILYCLIDRSTGRRASLSIWDTREAMDASEERAERQRQQAEETGGGKVVSIDKMEVVNVLYERRGDWRAGGASKGRLVRLVWARPGPTVACVSSWGLDRGALQK